MKKNNLKILCIIERVIIIGIVIRLCLFNINGDIRSLIILAGIFLYIFLPEQTKKKYNIKEERNIENNKEQNKEIEIKNLYDTEKINYNLFKNEETKDTNISVVVNSEENNYELPPIDLLSNDIEIKEIIQSKEYKDSKSKILVGVKEELKTLIIDIMETSHILIAGTTGIGKTMLLDNIIINTLYKSRPNEVKFVMLDTSNNGLRLYNGIPHLLIPVITDANKSIGALAWLVQEIENRNKIFINENVEDFIEFNQKMELDNKNKIPMIIVIIDEIFEIVNRDKESVEELLTKITRQGKKMGVFLIISTNRPSTDIVSGAIKANIYTRISFFLPSRLDSKLILDMDGAEKLKNHGDLLFKTIGITTPKKYHCPYLSIDGIKNVVNFLKKNETYYSENILENVEGHYLKDTFENIENTSYDINETDPLLMDAIDVVVETGQASTSFIQRRFKIGYARAGRIINQMEERGVISGYLGSKPRMVLMSIEKLNELKNK